MLIFLFEIIQNAILVSPLFAMSGDGVDDIRIPMVFLFMEEAKKLLEVLCSYLLNGRFNTIPFCSS